MPHSREHMGSRRIAPRPQANELNTSATATAKSRAQPHLPSIELKRAQVRAACLPCQRRKSKVPKLQTFTQTFTRFRLKLLIKLGQCDGNKPSCGHCMKKGAICEYDVDPGVTRLETVRRKNDALQREVDQLRELFGYIRTCPEVEAKQVYRQLRTANGLQDLIRLREGSDISLKQKHRMSGSENPACEPGSDVLSSSAIRVPARPWTLLAGCNEALGRRSCSDGAR
jgi:hypothetical protein